jgi:DNA-binding CsgD family transcriptional regulator
MSRIRPAAQTLREIERLCHAGLNSQTLRLEAISRLRKAIPVDGFFWATVDPATLLFTGSVIDAIPEKATPAFLANEFLRDDVNKFVDLARAPLPVRTLFTATGRQPERSARFREILAPMGFGDELRAALRVRDMTWAVMCLHRETDSLGFAPDEVEFLRQVAPILAAGLRAALLFEATADPGPSGPGLVILSDDLTVISTTSVADVWLAELGDWPARNEPPQAVRAVAAKLRAMERSNGVEPSDPPRARVLTRAGRWLVLHGARLADPVGDGRIAIILEQANATEVAPLALQAYGLTGREAQIAELVLRGWSTAEIGQHLAISGLTVQQHLKAVFDKTGARSRRDLVAQVFAQQFLPRMASR